jgi:hypothetical protein
VSHIKERMEREERALIVHTLKTSG